MKRILWIALVLATWYFAGMYRSLALTALFAAELLLTVLLFILSRFLRRQLSARYPAPRCGGTRGAECECRVLVSNRGRFPVTRVTLAFVLRRRGEKRRTVRHLTGALAPSASDEAFTFTVTPPLCGLYMLELGGVCAWDYLALFPAWRSCGETLLLASFPPERALTFELTPQTRALFGYTGDGQSPRGGETAEVRGLRAYQEGDSARRIDWKQSARLGSLRTREYERAEETSLSVFLDRREAAADWDLFYELLSAILLGLLRVVPLLRVSWHEEDAPCRLDVRSAGDCRALFWRLYETEGRPAAAESAHPASLLFDTGLELSCGGVPLRRFSAEDRSGLDQLRILF